ncbi:MAG TPA: hypothetical protein PLV42_01950 [bacterium]|nr:hypothetical protein [bacterium]
MNGPFLLEAKTIAREMNRMLPGCFLLCDVAKVVRSVGRAERELPTDLLARVGGKDAVWFYYEYTQNAKQAFELECQYYHRHFSTLTKRFHPKRPEGKDWTCSVGCGYK